ncbi:hypothetical protein NL676_022488 [Syzygium grande]|nr:hypothetical protein NL676_022488 [Syzygium grande]
MGSHAPPPPPAAAAVALPHFLLVTFPAQGHINPALQFAKRLLRGGAEVTFATSVSACSRMSKGQTHSEGLHFAAFSDGYDDGFKQGDDMMHFVSEVKRRGSEKLKDLIASSVGEGRPYTCLVYSLLIPWAAEVARDFHVPSALLWIQPATVLDMYYYYFHGYGEFIKNKCLDPSCSFELPGLPYKLTSRDLPSFLAPNSSGVYAFALPAFKDQLDTVDQENNPRILVNTFDSLEPEALRAIDRYNMVGIGPLIPSAFIDGLDPSDTSFGVDLFHKSKDYTEWLDSKAPASVIYVSFGSLAVISKRQAEELACALLDCGRPFLWVIRADQNGKEEKDEDRLSCMQELEEKGMIVPWCSQLEPFVPIVASHNAVPSPLARRLLILLRRWSCHSRISTAIPEAAFKRGADLINTWDDFVNEFRDYFFTEFACEEFAQQEACSKLHRLRQKGTVREYVKEFTELELQIPNLGEEEALGVFMDGLKPWA